MGWTKRQFIAAALEEIGLGTNPFDVTPEQLQSGQRKLDAMMDAWYAKGIRLKYPSASAADGGNPDEDTNVPADANEAIYTNLALRLGSAIGREPSPTLRTTASQGLSMLLTRFVQSIEMQIPNGMPAGAGNRGFGTRRRPFLDPPMTEGIAVDPNSDLKLK